MFGYSYIIISFFAKEEGKIRQASFVVCVVAFLYVGLSFAFFSTIFAVQPDVHRPESIRTHTIPFTNFMIALTVLALLVTWFGENVAWKHMKLPKFFFYVNRWVHQSTASGVFDLFIYALGVTYMEVIITFLWPIYIFWGQV